MRPYSPIRSRHVRLAALLTPILMAGLWPSSPAFAANGVLEINRTCAVQTGCFPGDAAGYPVTITGAAGRSYLLTSDLLLSGQDTTGIEISGDGMTIDLAGFRISCTNFVPPLTFQPCSTTGSGTGSGIEVDDRGTRSGVEVRNGSVFGMPRYGLDLGTDCVARDLRVSTSGLSGILTFGGCTIESNTVFENAGPGISTGDRCTVSGNVANLNGQNGIQAGSGCTVIGNTAANNAGSSGIAAAGIGSTVSGNTALNNAGNGFFCSGGCTVSGNTARSNGGSGIGTGSSSIVMGNSVSQNSQSGLALGNDDGYRENVISFNNGGAVSGGVNLGANHCNPQPCP